jgi:hypothetical protein
MVLRARDDRYLTVDDDQPLEELVERAYLTAMGGEFGDVLPRRRTLTRGVLVERPHLDAPVERAKIPVLRLGQLARRSAAIGLRREQLAARVADHGLEEIVDLAHAAKLRDRRDVGACCAAVGLAELREGLGPLCRLAEEVGSFAAEWNHHSCLYGRRVHRKVVRLGAVRYQQAEV